MALIIPRARGYRFAGRLAAFPTSGRSSGCAAGHRVRRDPGRSSGCAAGHRVRRDPGRFGGAARRFPEPVALFRVRRRSPCASRPRALFRVRRRSPGAPRPRALWRGGSPFSRARGAFPGAPSVTVCVATPGALPGAPPVTGRAAAPGALPGGSQPCRSRGGLPGEPPVTGRAATPGVLPGEGAGRLFLDPLLLL